MSDIEDIDDVSGEDIIYKWDSYLRSDCSVTERYAHDCRMGHLDYVVQMFKKCNYEMEEVKMYKNQIVNRLITEEGKKGKGRHKGWYDWVKGDFDAAVASYYIEIDVKDVEKVEHGAVKKVVKNNKTNHFRQDDDVEVMKWLDDNYNNITQLMIDEAHTPGTELNIKFILDLKL